MGHVPNARWQRNAPTISRPERLVVWDVDLLSENVVRVYRATDPETPTIYRRGEIAEAEPAVPGWTIAVDDLFPEE